MKPFVNFFEKPANSVNVFFDAFVEIDLNAIKMNIAEIKKTNANIKIMAVVKSNAYGHDIIEISKFLSKENMVSAFAVDNIDEAILLRKNGIQEDILLLRHTFPERFKELTEYDLIQTVDSKIYAEQLNNSSNARVHIEIDTGMGRTGILADDVVRCVDEIRTMFRLPNIHIEGIFTHLSVADGITLEEDIYTKKQIQTIKNVYGCLLDFGIKIEHCHFLNSAGFLYHYDVASTYVRLGIILYGLCPNFHKGVSLNLHPALSVKARISYIKIVDKGTYIGYGRTYCTEKRTVIATIPIGYAHGYPRALSNKSKVIVNDVLAPTIGTICMGNMMIDVTDIENVNVGDVVTVVGSSEHEKITLDSLANDIGSINYELACRFSFVLPKVIVNR